MRADLGEAEAYASLRRLRSGCLRDFRLKMHGRAQPSPYAVVSSPVHCSLRLTLSCLVQQYERAPAPWCLVPGKYKRAKGSAQSRPDFRGLLVLRSWRELSVRRLHERHDRRHRQRAVRCSAQHRCVRLRWW